MGLVSFLSGCNHARQRWWWWRCTPARGPADGSGENGQDATIFHRFVFVWQRWRTTRGSATRLGAPAYRACLRAVRVGRWRSKARAAVQVCWRDDLRDDRAVTVCGDGVLVAPSVRRCSRKRRVGLSGRVTGDREGPGVPGNGVPVAWSHQLRMASRSVRGVSPTCLLPAWRDACLEASSLRVYCHFCLGALTDSPRGCPACR